MARPTPGADSRTGYQQVSRRKKWGLFLEDSGLQTLVEGVSILLALLSVVIYVYATYDLAPSTQDTFHAMNFVLSVIFLAHYLGALWLADSRTAFIFHHRTIIDAVTIFPGFTEYLEAHSSFGATFLFLRALRVVRVLRVLRLLRAGNLFSTDVHQRIFRLAFTFGLMVFCSAGFFFELEQGAREAAGSPDPVQVSGYLPTAAANHTGPADLMPLIQLNGTAGDSTSTRFYFHEALYWSAITIATVGYGDIYPITTEGRVMVLLLLLLMLYLIPYHTGKLLEALSATNPYLRATYFWHRRREHILLTGSLDQLAVHSFVHELYHPDHGYQSHDTVLLHSELPDRHIKALLKSRKMASRLTYAQGSPHTPEDLSRVSAHRAKAIFVLADQGADDPAREDMANIMLLLAMGQYLQRYHYLRLNKRPIQSLLKKVVHRLRPRHSAQMDAVNAEIPRLFIQLLLPESHHQLLQLLGVLQYQPHASNPSPEAGFRSHHCTFWATLSADVTVIGITELRQALLGQSCLACPGVVGLVSNLSCTANLCNLPINHDSDEDWFKQYQDGSQMEVHRVKDFPAHLHGQPFATVALFLYQQYHSVLLGTVRIGDRGSADNVKLAPFEEFISNGSIGFIIASSMKVSQDISKSKGQTFENWLAGSWGECSKGGALQQRALQQEGSSSSDTEMPPISRQGGPPPSPKGDGCPQRTLGAQQGTQAPPSSLSHMASPQRHTPQGAPRNLEALSAGSESSGGPDSPPKQHGSQRRKAVLSLSRLRGSGSPPRQHLQRDSPGVQRADVLQSLGSSKVVLPSTTAQVTRTKDLLRRSHMRPKPLLAPHLVLDKVDTSGHILVLLCSPLCVEELVGIVGRLRSLCLQLLHPIVIVTAELPADNHFQSLAGMEEVWFMLGDPKSADDLQRAGAERACKALLLGGPRETATKDMSLREGALADAEVVFAFQYLKTINPNLEIYSQVVLSTSAAFLGAPLPFVPLTTRDGAFVPRDTVVYAAGCVLLPEIFANITCQAFYSCHVYELIKKLLNTRGIGMAAPLAPFSEPAPAKYTAPPNSPQSSSLPRGSRNEGLPTSPVSHGSHSHAAVPAPERSLVVVPVDLHPLPSCTYGAWFSYCLQQQQLLCLGLYRSNVYGGDTSYFVYTNPPPEAQLYPTDRAFVVASGAQQTHLIQAFADAT